MPTFPTTPYQTTLAAALTASDIQIYTAASTGFVAGKYLAIGKEILLLTTVDLTNHTHVAKRGMKGTAAGPHVSGAIVTLGTAATFGPNTDKGIEIAGYTGGAINCVPMLPIGSRQIDPDTGYEYLLCDMANTYVAGTWVQINADGLATILTNALKGRVGVVVEAAGSSDRLAWVMVVGSYSAALFAHTAAAVTTATLLTASGTISGALGSPTTCSLQQTRVFGVVCTVALTTGSCPITGANPGTAYLNNPWTHGVVEKGDLYTA